MLEDIMAVKKFEEIICYKKEGTGIVLNVEASVDDKLVYQETTTCYFSYNAGYGQCNVTVDWNISNDVMSNLGLHGSYKTNFQRMVVEKRSLIITGYNYRIRLWKE